MADLIHKFGTRKHKRGSSFKWATDVIPEVIGETDQHSADGGSKDQAIVVKDSPEMGFHGQLDMETARLADLGEVPLTHEEVWGDISSEHIVSRLTKAMSTWAGVVGRYFLTGCYYIPISLHRTKLPLWRKYQLPGPKEPMKLSSVGHHSTEANPWPPIWSNYTQ